MRGVVHDHIEPPMLRHDLGRGAFARGLVEDVEIEDIEVGARLFGAACDFIGLVPVAAARIADAGEDAVAPHHQRPGGEEAHAGAGPGDQYGTGHIGSLHVRMAGQAAQAVGRTTISLVSTSCGWPMTCAIAAAIASGFRAIRRYACIPSAATGSVMVSASSDSTTPG